MTIKQFIVKLLFSNNENDNAPEKWKGDDQALSRRAPPALWLVAAASVDGALDQVIAD